MIKNVDQGSQPPEAPEDSLAELFELRDRVAGYLEDNRETVKALDTHRDEDPDAELLLNSASNLTQQIESLVGAAMDTSKVPDLESVRKLAEDWTTLKTQLESK